MTGESAHTISKERTSPDLMFLSEHAPQLLITDSKVKWPLCFQLYMFSRYTMLQTKNSRSAPAINPVTMKNTDNLHTPTINCWLESEVATMLRSHLFSVRYRYKQRTVLEAPLQSTQSPCKIQLFTEAMHRATVNRHLGLKQRRTKVSPWCMDCMYCGMPKGTSWDKATLNSEKNQACSLSRYIELHSPEGIS